MEKEIFDIKGADKEMLMYIGASLVAFAVQVVPQVRNHEIVKQNSKVIDIVIPAVITFSMTRSVNQAAFGMGRRTIFAYLLIVAHIGFALYKSGQLNTIIDKINNK